MQLHEIKIRNFKQFEDIRIEFSDQFNLIVGDNGVGKTSVLEAILVALGGFLSGWVSDAYGWNSVYLVWAAMNTIALVIFFLAEIWHHRH